jgi:hypothetical protein
MIGRLVHFALRQPLFTVVMVVLFVGAGVFAFVQPPIEAFPDVSDTQVQVITLYPGRAPEEVEKQVTIPLEIALSAVPHAVRAFSHTQFGLSYVVITFDDKVDDYFARAHPGATHSGGSAGRRRARPRAARDADRRALPLRVKATAGIRATCARSRTGWSSAISSTRTAWPTS